MKFAKRMDRFGEGVFSSLAEIRKQKEEKGETVIDLSIGAPNIPPAEHIRRALCEAAADEKITSMPSMTGRSFWKRRLAGMRGATE